MGLDYAIRYPVLTIGSGPGQLAARRRVPHGLRRRARRRRGRHLDRRRRARRRLPARVGRGGRDRRHPHELPHARRARHRARRRDASCAGRRRDGGARTATASASSSRGEALVFGGETPTLTDAAVAAGRAEVGAARAAGAARGSCWRPGSKQPMRCSRTRSTASRSGAATGRSSLVGGGSVLVAATACRACPRSCAPRTTTWRTRSAPRSPWRAGAGRKSCTSTAAPRRVHRRGRREGARSGGAGRC